MRSFLFSPRWPAFWSRLGLLFVLAALSGCSGQGQGKVTGQVLFEGQPLPGGWVNFRPVDPRKNAVAVALDEHGHFEAVLPVGEVEVSIDNRELEPVEPLVAGGLPAGLPKLSPEVAKVLSAEKIEKSRPKRKDKDKDKAKEKAALPGSSRYVKIPDRYYDPASSNLKFTVERGDQTKDIELTR
jgi:hypothetical protein